MFWWLPKRVGLNFAYSQIFSVNPMFLIKLQRHGNYIVKSMIEALEYTCFSIPVRRCIILRLMVTLTLLSGRSTKSHFAHNDHSWILALNERSCRNTDMEHRQVPCRQKNVRVDAADLPSIEKQFHTVLGVTIRQLRNLHNLCKQFILTGQPVTTKSYRSIHWDSWNMKIRIICL